MELKTILKHIQSIFIVTLILLFHKSIAKNDSKGTEKDKFLYSSNKHNINENPDKCAMLNQVQSVVIQLLGSHYEYSKGIEALTVATNTIQTDIAVLKTKIYKLENNTENLQEDFRNLSDNGSDCSPVMSQLKQKTNATKVLKQLMTNNENRILKSGLAANMAPVVEKDFMEQVKNLTKNLYNKDKTIASLGKTIKKIRRMVSQVQGKLTSFGQKFKNNSAETQSMNHFLKKQKQVNGQLLNRVQYLEEHIKQMTQSDSPNMQPNGCPSGFIRHFSSCYMFRNDSKNWIDAEKFCQNLHPHSHLVGIETVEEETFVVMYRNYNSAHWSSMYIWTGANDIGKENGWIWVSSGKKISYTNWRPGQPDNHNSQWQHCIYFKTDGQDHRWDDWHCHAAKLNYVCEIGLQAK